MRWLVLFVIGTLFSPVAIAAKPALTEKQLQAKLETIKLFEKEEKFSRAEKEYRTLVNDASLTKPQRSKVRNLLEDLPVRMIFSKAKTPGSVIHTVKEKETLSTLAKKYKTNPELIKKINGLKTDEIITGSKLKVINGRFEIKVDKSENVLSLYFNNKPIKKYRVTTGAKNKTPVGKFKIINKVENPTWYFGDQAIPAESKKNLIGTRWMGFDKPSYGIHGTTEPEEIGKQASLGCVRMLNRDVEELYLLVPHQTNVTIVN